MKKGITSGALVLAVSITLAVVPVSGLSLEELAGPEKTAALLAGDKPMLAQFKEPNPQLVPGNEFLRKQIEALRLDLKPSVMVETLYIYKKPGAANTTWSAGEETALYNNLLAMSSLAGLQYYSASRGAMRIFYETSLVIDGPATKKPLPDPVYERPPAKLTLFARQKDLTFGDNVYQYDYYLFPGGMAFVQQNLTAMTAGIVPVAARQKLRSVMAVLDANEYILVYAASMAKAASLPGMNDRVGNSFANRAEAINHWFEGQADKVFGKH